MIVEAPSRFQRLVRVSGDAQVELYRAELDGREASLVRAMGIEVVRFLERNGLPLPPEASGVGTPTTDFEASNGLEEGPGSS